MKLSGILTLLLIAGAAFGAYKWSQYQKQPKTINEFMKAAQEALAAGDTKTARAVAVDAKAAFPNDNRPLLLASAASSLDGKFEDAIEFLREPFDDAYYVDARLRLGILQLAQGHVKDGRKSLEDVIKLDPMNFDANSQLFRLMRVEGRNWEARPILFRLWLQGRYSVMAAMTLATVDSVFVYEDEDKEFLELCAQAHPDYPVPLMGQGILAIQKGEVDKGLRMLDEVLEADPTITEAIAQKGAVLFASKRTEDFDQWRTNIPQLALTHPLVWETLGRYAQLNGRNKEAARCYWESLRLNPDRATVCTTFVEILRLLDRKKDANLFSKRGRLLGEMFEYLVAGRPTNPAQMSVIIDKLEELHRLPEAMAWCAMGASEKDQSLAERHKALDKEWGNKSGTLADADNPVLKVDLSDYPLPEGVEINYDPHRMWLGTDVIEQLEKVYGTKENPRIVTEEDLKPNATTSEDPAKGQSVGVGSK